MYKKNTIPQYQKTAYCLIAFLVLLVIASLLLIGSKHWQLGGKPNSVTAELYQDGELIKSIVLTEVKESYTFIVTGENGNQNEVEVRQGSIRVLSATCPDKLCVQQGFISDSTLPITCLPNRLVIQIREEKKAKNDLPDVITY